MLGTADIDTFKLGSLQVDKIMLGSDEVWKKTYVLQSPDNMTDFTHALGTISASSYSSSGSLYPWHTMDGVLSVWGTSYPNPTGWLLFEFASSGEVISKYSLVGTSADTTLYPKTWTFEGSDTGDFTGEEIVLDSQVNVASFPQHEVMEYIISNTVSYKYYKLNITLNQGHPNSLYLDNWALYSD